MLKDWYSRPKFKVYGLVNAHTGEVVEEFDTRSQAKAGFNARLDWALRVRGVR